MPRREKKILFATDYSESSQSALTYAASFARDLGATLLVAHVCELEQYPVGELFDEEPQPSDEDLAELKVVKPPDPRIPCEHRLLYGDPAEQIVRLADREAVEAIVIGTHDRSRLTRLMGGSVAEKLLRTAHCPVITYRVSPQSTAVGADDAPRKGLASDGRGPAPEAVEKHGRTSCDADLQRTVKEWVSGRSALYNIFRTHDIDVLWDGDRRLIDVCREKGINPRHIADDLAEASQPAFRETGVDWYGASLTALCDHLESTHHDYLRRELPRLGALVKEIGEQSRVEHPELDELTALFDGFRQQILEHVEVEERALFPALRAVDVGEKSAAGDEVDPRGLARQMKDDHDRIGLALLKIRRLTNGYTPPANASSTHRAMVAGLWELEANLQLAMREEDQILFPMAQSR